MRCLLISASRNPRTLGLKHMTGREIAEELFISENTVKYHKANMLAKTGFSRAVDLAFYMISNGWINPKY